MQEQIVQISYIEKNISDELVFENWWRSTNYYLEKIFGKDSTEASEFDQMVFYKLAIHPTIEDRLSVLNIAKPMLERFIKNASALRKTKTKGEENKTKMHNVEGNSIIAPISISNKLDFSSVNSSYKEKSKILENTIVGIFVTVVDGIVLLFITH